MVQQENESMTAAVRDTLQQFWRDVLSIYYANTPTWRWLKSGALVFLGFFAWMSGAVLLSVEPSWGFLTYLMAYGFLLIAWGPFTHLVVVPVTITLRRTANHPALRWFSKNSGKVNLTIFFTLVVVLGTLTPSVMLLEFSPSLTDDGAETIEGELVCEKGDTVLSCAVENPAGIERLEVTSGGETLTTVEGPPFEFELRRGNIAETRTGQQFTVLYYDTNGEIGDRQIRRV